MVYSKKYCWNIRGHTQVKNFLCVNCGYTIYAIPDKRSDFLKSYFLSVAFISLACMYFSVQILLPVLIASTKVLRTIVNTPWCVRNEDIRKDLKIQTVKEEIGRYAKKKIQGKNGNTSKPTGCWSEQNSHRKKTKKKTPHWSH